MRQKGHEGRETRLGQINEKKIGPVSRIDRKEERTKEVGLLRDLWRGCCC